MAENAIDPKVIEHFCHLFRELDEGSTGKVLWDEIGPLSEEERVLYSQINHPHYTKIGEAALGRLAQLRLNGGLGTTMILDHTKSIIEVKPGYTFIDIAAHQILNLRKHFQHEIPWLLMNSYHTQEETLRLLKPYSLQVPWMPLDFLQHKFPRIHGDTRQPVSFPEMNDGWAPPGHGDVFWAMWLSGILEKMLEQGIRWIFASNIDNVGAEVDPAILGYLENHNFDFAMEVTPKTLADVKGGIVVKHGGRLILVEAAQVPDNHLEDFIKAGSTMNFNTNNLWWRIDTLLELLQSEQLKLPLIVNPKMVNDTPVLQLETAMGAAISCFPRPALIVVPRRRFVSVKTTHDLLSLRSDLYSFDRQMSIQFNPQRIRLHSPPIINLDPRYYRSLLDFERRFPFPVSLAACDQLIVEGDIVFGRGISFEGSVIIRNTGPDVASVPDGTCFQSGEFVLNTPSF